MSHLHMPRSLPALGTLVDALPMSRADAAALMGVSRRTLERWCRDDTGPRLASVVAWLAGAGRAYELAELERRRLDLQALVNALQMELRASMQEVERLRSVVLGDAANDAGVWSPRRRVRPLSPPGGGAPSRAGLCRPPLPRMVSRRGRWP